MSVSKPSLPGLISEIPQRRGHLEGGRSSSSPAPLQFSLVIPTYNERHNLRSLIERLSQLLDRLLGHDYELIIVDDDSPDRTWELAQDLADSYPQVRALRRQGERGLSTAVICGWQRARGQILGVIDADLQHPPEVLEQLWQQIERGADLALASRHVDGGGG